MAIRKKTLSTLKEERERIIAERKRMDMTLERIDALIATEEANVPAKKVRLRPHILDFIGDHHEGVTAYDIARHVELSGYKPKGYTSTRTLVYSELARLVREDKINKDKDGKYVIPMLNF